MAITQQQSAATKAYLESQTGTSVMPSETQRIMERLGRPTYPHSYDPVMGQRARERMMVRTVYAKRGEYTRGGQLRLTEQQAIDYNIKRAEENLMRIYERKAQEGYTQEQLKTWVLRAEAAEGVMMPQARERLGMPTGRAGAVSPAGIYTPAEMGEILATISKEPTPIVPVSKYMARYREDRGIGAGPPSRFKDTALGRLPPHMQQAWTAVQHAKAVYERKGVRPLDRPAEELGRESKQLDVYAGAVTRLTNRYNKKVEAFNARAIATASKKTYNIQDYKRLQAEALALDTERRQIDAAHAEIQAESKALTGKSYALQRAYTVSNRALQMIQKRAEQRFFEQQAGVVTPIAKELLGQKEGRAFGERVGRGSVKVGEAIGTAAAGYFTGMIKAGRTIEPIFTAPFVGGLRQAHKKKGILDPIHFGVAAYGTGYIMAAPMLAYAGTQLAMRPLTYPGEFAKGAGTAFFADPIGFGIRVAGARAFFGDIRGVPAAAKQFIKYKGKPIGYKAGTFGAKVYTAKQWAKLTPKPVKLTGFSETLRKYSPFEKAIVKTRTPQLGYEAVKGRYGKDVWGLKKQTYYDTETNLWLEQKGPTEFKGPGGILLKKGEPTMQSYYKTIGYKPTLKYVTIKTYAWKIKPAYKAAYHKLDYSTLIKRAMPKVDYLYKITGREYTAKGYTPSIKWSRPLAPKGIVRTGYDFASKMDKLLKQQDPFKEYTKLVYKKGPVAIEKARFVRLDITGAEKATGTLISKTTLKTPLFDLSKYKGMMIKTPYGPKAGVIMYKFTPKFKFDVAPYYKGKSALDYYKWKEIKDVRKQYIQFPSRTMEIYKPYKPITITGKAVGAARGMHQVQLTKAIQMPKTIQATKAAQAIIHKPVLKAAVSTKAAQKQFTITMPKTKTMQIMKQAIKYKPVSIAAVKQMQLKDIMQIQAPRFKVSTVQAQRFMRVQKQARAQATAQVFASAAPTAPARVTIQAQEFISPQAQAYKLQAPTFQPPKLPMLSLLYEERPKKKKKRFFGLGKRGKPARLGPIPLLPLKEVGRIEWETGKEARIPAGPKARKVMARELSEGYMFAGPGMVKLYKQQRSRKKKGRSIRPRVRPRLSRLF